MATPNILTDTTPVLDPDRPGVASSVITDAWGLYFAQGGVVMAAALRAMEVVLDRPDLRLASASATFCRPVACGPVTTTVEVLRNGRRGAQVHGDLRGADLRHADPGAGGGAGAEAGTSVAVTAVFTDPTLDGPVLTPVVRPADLVGPPSPDAPPRPRDDGFPLGFLDNTEWQVASGTTPPSEPPPTEGLPTEAPPTEGLPTEGLPRLSLWFRFRDDPAAPGAAWDPALLPIPGDSLGSALVVALGGGDTPVGSVSLQIGIEVFAPVRGTWIGIDSTCTHVGRGLASGVLHLWSEAGDHVATVTQTAMLRAM